MASCDCRMTVVGSLGARTCAGNMRARAPQKVCVTSLVLCVALGASVALERFKGSSVSSA